MRFEEELIELLPRLRRFARGLAQSAADADEMKAKRIVAPTAGPERMSKVVNAASAAPALSR